MEAKEKWDQLTEQHRGQLLERHRVESAHDEWWDDVYEVFKEDMSAIGVHVETIYFSGFWSQGDGACFEGHVADWAKFLNALGRPDAARVMADLEGCTGVRLIWNHSGHYYHEHCTAFVADLAIDNPHDNAEQPLRHAAWEAMHGTDGPLVPLKDEFIEFLKDKMRDLYKQLEKEHEYLTSDEVVAEYILEYEEGDIDELLDEQHGEQRIQEEHAMI